MTPLWDRMVWAHQNIERKECPFAIVWEDPDNPEAPAAVTRPTASYWAFLLTGGIVPPIGAWLEEHKARRHLRVHHANPIGPLSESEALRYILQKDVPARVWKTDGNRRRYQFIHVSLLPRDRTYRDAWFLDDETGTIGIHHGKTTA